MKAIPFLYLLATSAFLAGCANNAMDEKAIDSVVGQTRTELVQCAGTPSGTLNAIGRQFLTYRANVGPERFRYTTWCVLTFTVEDGRVTRWKGKWDGPVNDPAAACQQIMTHCLL